MNRQDSHSSSHAVYTIHLHIVFATQYRRKAITPLLLADLLELFAEILSGWRCSLLEFGGEADHVHLLETVLLASSLLCGQCRTCQFGDGETLREIPRTERIQNKDK